MLNDYEKLSTTYHEYIRGNDISNDIEIKGRNRSKRKFKHNIVDAKKRLSRLKKLSDSHERGLLQTVSPDVENNNPLIKPPRGNTFLKSTESYRNNCHTSMSTSPDPHSIISMGMVKSTFGVRKKKFNLQRKFEGRAMKWFPITSNLSKRASKLSETQKDRLSNGRISKGSINRSSANELDKISSLVQKLHDVSTVKDKLAGLNQTFKFRIAELQREKYLLTQLNKKLSSEVSKNRIQDQGIVILK
jgi:hypothetical protein